jgi:protein phosphatase PTC2/3
VHGILAVSRAFGDIQFKACGHAPGLVTATPDIRTIHITKVTEFVVLASDGLWDVMIPQDVINFIRRRATRRETLPQIVHNLTHEALNLGSVDNVTVMILVFNLLGDDNIGDDKEEYGQEEEETDYIEMDSALI